MKKIFLCLTFLLVALISATCVCAASDVSAQDAVVGELDDSLAIDDGMVSDNQDIAVEEVDDDKAVVDEIDVKEDSVVDECDNTQSIKNTLSSENNDDTVANLVKLYGSNTKEELSSKLGISEDEVCAMITDLKHGKYGKDYKKIMIAKEEDLRDEMDRIESYIVTDFNTTEQSYINQHIEDYHPHGVTPDLVEYVAASYGHAGVSLMAFRAAVSCGEIIDTIHEIKLGKHGDALKNRFEDFDDKNLAEVNKLADYIIC